MRQYNQFLTKQIARYGAMSIPQMQYVCTGKCGRATLYRMLDDLLGQQLIKRMPHCGNGKFLFSPRPTLMQQVYGEKIKRNTGLNETNILHAAEVTETLLTLSRYSFVTGIATEHEMDSKEVSKFCHSRTPDGIIQITNGANSFVLAVEVERVKKSHARVEEVIENYKTTILKEMPCAGLLVVTKDQSIFDTYQSKISTLPNDLEKRFLVVKINELSTLNQTYFGEFRDVPQSSLEMSVTFSQGVPEFTPMITDSSVGSVPHIVMGS
jgi:hypothetical protein